MRFIGYKGDAALMIGRVTSEGTVVPVVDIETFYSDLDFWAKQPGDPARAIKLTDIQEVPAVPIGAAIFCVGLNYRAHAAEVKRDVSEEHPVIFGRWTRSLVVDGATVPALDERLDWEGEVAAIIGKPLFKVDQSAVANSIFGYAAFNDISARSYQRHTHQWTLGKNAVSGGPIGPVVTYDEVGDLKNGLELKTIVNGEVVQQASTADMIHSLDKVVAYISEVFALRPGDVIATGTPGGVGVARTPPRFLKPGDWVEIEVEKLSSKIRQHDRRLKIGVPPLFYAAVG